MGSGSVYVKRVCTYIHCVCVCVCACTGWFKWFLSSIDECGRMNGIKKTSRWRWKRPKSEWFIIIKQRQIVEGAPARRRVKYRCWMCSDYIYIYIIYGRWFIYVPAGYTLGAASQLPYTLCCTAAPALFCCKNRQLSCTLRPGGGRCSFYLQRDKRIER